MAKFEFLKARKTPDFEELKKVIRGEKKAERVHFVELLMDYEIKKAVTEQYLGEKWIDPAENNKADYIKQDINFWYHLGYDYARISGGIKFPGKGRKTEDTAILSKGKRNWVEENTGMITNWEEFERYPWQKKEDIDYSAYEIASKNLPDGMKLLVCPSSGVFEIASEVLLGFENMSYLIAENYELVQAVFDKTGEIIYEFYRNVVEIDNVEGFFQGDDLGFKTSTFLSPHHLKRLVIPWHKKFAELAHQKGKMYWFHCCGNILNVIDDFIHSVKIDAIHSFQDEVIPVWKFKQMYGNKTAVLGGVDVDKLSRLDEPNLRKYVKAILQKCMPYRYALGSGNSVANYIPVENYLIMLDEGWNFTTKS
jgi:uroporphyrinogen decarboxylase